MPGTARRDQSVSLGISTYIETHRSLISELTRAISRDDSAKVEHIDKLITSTFYRVIDHEAETPEQAVEQAQFLLDYLAPESERTSLDARVCDKLLSLVAT